MILVPDNQEYLPAPNFCRVPAVKNTFSNSKTNRIVKRTIFAREVILFII